MKRFRIELHLLEDLVLPAGLATAGAPRNLDYIPGAALLGCCAARLYRRLSRDEAFRVFHSGAVRFGNGRPLDSHGNPGLPMPLAWHVEKGRSYRQEAAPNLLDGSAVVNLTGTRAEPGRQLRQLREGFISPEGEIIVPETVFRLKTAIDPASGTAAEAQLFGYGSLRAGQRFLAWLDIDDEIAQETEDKIRESLTGTLRLGRSRSAQYGTVQAEVTAGEPPVLQTGGDTTLRLFLLSDMALCDSYGQPCLLPAAGNLGLPVDEVVWEQSFLRHRTYSPYNATWRCRDQERQVICQGSVLTLYLKRPLDRDDCERLAKGVGLHRQHGLGQVLVDPDLLCGEPPRPKPVAEKPVDDHDQEKQPDNLLVRFLVAQQKAAGTRGHSHERAEELFQELRDLYRAAAGYAGLERELVGPGKSQWSRVMETAKRTDDLHPALQDIVGLEGESLRIGDDAWAVPTGLPGHQRNFGCWLLYCFDGTHGYDCSAVASLLARKAMNLVEDPAFLTDKEVLS